MYIYPMRFRHMKIKLLLHKYLLLINYFIRGLPPTVCICAFLEEGITYTKCAY